MIRGIVKYSEGYRFQVKRFMDRCDAGRWSSRPSYRYYARKRNRRDGFSILQLFNSAVNLL